MAEKVTKIQLRRAAAQATFEANNPVLLAGEPAIALDTGILKIGDGVSTYNQLPEIGASPDLSQYVTRTELAEDLEGYVESSDLAAVATSGSYNDLRDTPTIPDTSGFVDTTSNQSIGGIKTFTGSGIALSNVNGTAIALNNGTVQFALGLDSTGKAALISTNQDDYKIYTTNTDFLLDTSMLDNQTIVYDNTNGVIKAQAPTVIDGGNASAQYPAELNLIVGNEPRLNPLNMNIQIS